MYERYYQDQVRLLVQCLPEIGRHRNFALKGGTAINLFVRNLPRISVDIDLAYLPLSNRQEALEGIQKTLLSIKEDILRHVPGTKIGDARVGGHVLKLTVSTETAAIKIEPNTVVRGSVFPPQQSNLCPNAQEVYQVSCEAPTLSMPDLYGGKLCAALDRQHPRDLFDVKVLLEKEGVTEEIRKSFVVYLASHNRPMNELLMPKFKDIESVYNSQFLGMTKEKIEIPELMDVQHALPGLITSLLDELDKNFLLSLKRGDPEWHLLGIENIDQLPAIRWKLVNIEKMSKRKRQEATERLVKALGQ